MVFQVSTIRTLPSGSGGSAGESTQHRVEVTARPVGVLGRVIAGLISLFVVAALVVLAIIAIPLLLVGLGVLVVFGIAWLAWVLVRGRMVLARAGRGGSTAPDEGRENVRVRRDESPL